MNLKCLNCLSLALKEFLTSNTYPHNWVDRYFQRFSEFFIFHSIYAMQEYRKIHFLKKPVSIIPISAYIIDQTYFKTLSNKSQRDKGEKRLVVPGYVSPFKGHDILIKAASNVEGDFKLIFLGAITNRDYEKYLKKLVDINKIGDQVEFKGFVNEAEFMSQMGDAYLIIIPRLLSPWLKEKIVYKLRKRFNLNYLISQSSSAVLGHAFALGKPIICSKIKAFSELVDSNTGILCDNTVKNWSESIQFMLDNPERVMKMSVNSKKFADEILNPVNIAKKHVKVYDHLYENHNNNNFEQNLKKLTV